MRTTKKKLLSVILTLAMLLSMMPMAMLAAPAKDLPTNMADSPILRALEYTGYDVQKQKNDGTLYQSGHYGRYVSEDILSGITYGTGPSGKETVADSSTPTGKAPDIAKFQKQGLCCLRHLLPVQLSAECGRGRYGLHANGIHCGTQLH